MDTYVKVSVSAIARGRATNRRYRYHMSIFVNNICIWEDLGKNYNHLNRESAVKEGIDRVVGAADRNGYAVLIITTDNLNGRLYLPKIVYDYTIPPEADTYERYRFNNRGQA